MNNSVPIENESFLHRDSTSSNVQTKEIIPEEEKNSMRFVQMFKDFLGLGKITFDLEKHKVFCIKINNKWTIRKQMLISIFVLWIAIITTLMSQLIIIDGSIQVHQSQTSSFYSINSQQIQSINNMIFKNIDKMLNRSLILISRANRNYTQGYYDYGFMQDYSEIPLGNNSSKFYFNTSTTYGMEIITNFALKSLQNNDYFESSSIIICAQQISQKSNINFGLFQTSKQKISLDLINQLDLSGKDEYFIQNQNVSLDSYFIFSRNYLDKTNQIKFFVFFALNNNYLNAIPNIKSQFTDFSYLLVSSALVINCNTGPKSDFLLNNITWLSYQYNSTQLCISNPIPNTQIFILAVPTTNHAYSIAIFSNYDQTFTKLNQAINSIYSNLIIDTMKKILIIISISIALVLIVILYILYLVKPLNQLTQFAQNLNHQKSSKPVQKSKGLELENIKAHGIIKQVVELFSQLLDKMYQTRLKTRQSILKLDNVQQYPSNEQIHIDEDEIKNILNKLPNLNTPMGGQKVPFNDSNKTNRQTKNITDEVESVKERITSIIGKLIPK